MRRVIASLVCLLLIVPAISRAAETHQLEQISVDEVKQLAQDTSGRLALDNMATLSTELAGELA